MSDNTDNNKKRTQPLKGPNLSLAWKIRKAARAVLNLDSHMTTDFEHGRWWVTDLKTGRQWSVVDANTLSGFDFEQAEGTKTYRVEVIVPVYLEAHNAAEAKALALEHAQVNPYLLDSLQNAFIDDGGAEEFE